MVQLDLEVKPVEHAGQAAAAEGRKNTAKLICLLLLSKDRMDFRVWGVGFKVFGGFAGCMVGGDGGGGGGGGGGGVRCSYDMNHN